MVALPKPQRTFTGSHTVARGSFKRLVVTCENPPKAGQALKDLVKQGRFVLRQKK